MHREFISCTVASQDGYIHTAQTERTAAQYEVIVGKQKHWVFLFHTRTMVSHYRRPGGQGRHSRMNHRHKFGVFARQGMILLLSSLVRDPNGFLRVFCACGLYSLVSSVLKSVWRSRHHWN
jgi:hypothetical protein